MVEKYDLQYVAYQRVLNLYWGGSTTDTQQDPVSHQFHNPLADTSSNHFHNPLAGAPINQFRNVPAGPPSHKFPHVFVDFITFSLIFADLRKSSKTTSG